MTKAPTVRRIAAGHVGSLVVLGFALGTPFCSAGPDRVDAVAHFEALGGKFLFADDLQGEVDAPGQARERQPVRLFLFSYRSEVTDADLARLRELPTLKWLTLDRVPVTDVGLGHVRHLPDLEHLSLPGTGITDAGLTNLKALQNLVELDLAKTTVAGSGLAHLVELPKLSRLSLSWTRINDSAFMHVAKCTELEHLDFCGTRVTDAGAGLLGKLPELNSLQLWETHVSEAALIGLMRSKPDMHVVWRDPADTDHTARLELTIPDFPDTLKQGWQELTFVLANTSDSDLVIDDWPDSYDAELHLRDTETKRLTRCPRFGVSADLGHSVLIQAGKRVTFKQRFAVNVKPGRYLLTASFPHGDVETPEREIGVTKGTPVPEIELRK